MKPGERNNAIKIFYSIWKGGEIMKMERNRNARKKEVASQLQTKVRFQAMIAVTAFALVLILATAAHAQTAPVFDVVLTKQTPYPVQPGTNVNVEVEVQNTGLGDANNVVVQIVPADPFKLVAGTEQTTTFSRISASNSVKISYNLQVNDSAVSNQYDLEFRIYYVGNPTNYISQKVQVNVQGQPDFIIDSTWTTPENIEPGGTVNVFAKLKNVGTGTASNVQASFNSSSGVLIPVLSRGSVYLGDIKPNADAVADIQLSIDSLAGQQTYPATLTLSYKDETGTVNQESFSLGIPVTGVIDLQIINIQANFDRDVLQIDIANKGTADANSLQGTLIMNNQTVGIDYTSQLKATKKTTLEFPLGPEGPANLVLTYTSPNLQQFQVDKPIDVRYQNPNQSNPATTLVLVIIVAVIAYLVWRRFFRKKKK
jgi:hypothetical protein